MRVLVPLRLCKQRARLGGAGFGVCKQRVLRTNVILDLPLPPRVLLKSGFVFKLLSSAVKQSESDKIRFSFPKAEEMVPGFFRLVHYVMHERALKARSHRVSSRIRKCSQDCQIC